MALLGRIQALVERIQGSFKRICGIAFRTTIGLFGRAYKDHFIACRARVVRTIKCSLWREYSALLREYRALLREYRALLSEFRANLRAYRALSRAYSSLFIALAVSTMKSSCDRMWVSFERLLDSCYCQFTSV